MALTRDLVASVPDVSETPLVKVMVPEWAPPAYSLDDAFVYVKKMSSAERDAFESSLVKRKGKKVEQDNSNFRARLAVATCCDETRQPIFSINDLKMLGERDPAPLVRISEEAVKLNKLSVEDDEELEKK